MKLHFFCALGSSVSCLGNRYEINFRVQAGSWVFNDLFFFPDKLQQTVCCERESVSAKWGGGWGEYVYTAISSKVGQTLVLVLHRGMRLHMLSQTNEGLVLKMHNLIKRKPLIRWKYAELILVF